MFLDDSAFDLSDDDMAFQANTKASAAATPSNIQSINSQGRHALNSRGMVEI